MIDVLKAGEAMLLWKTPHALVQDSRLKTERQAYGGR
jgi:hypothetical protein